MKRITQDTGLLFDLDGVFYIGNRLMDKASETILHIKESNIPYRFITNKTTRSRQMLSEKLQDLGLPILEQEIISAPYAARLYLQHQRNQRCYFVISDDVKSEFEEFETSETNPDYVVIGDIGSAWDYNLINTIFGMLMNGATLIGLHKNRFWQTPDGLRLDIGAFISGLEYASNQEAVVIGKPSPTFFEMAASQLDRPKEKVIMVGDDIDSDIGGAHASGIKGILVKTGKYRQSYVDRSSITPDRIIDSVWNLTELIT